MGGERGGESNQMLQGQISPWKLPSSVNKDNLEEEDNMKHLVYLINKSTAVTIQFTHPAKHGQPLSIRYVPISELIVLKNSFAALSMH